MKIVSGIWIIQAKKYATGRKTKPVRTNIKPSKVDKGIVHNTNAFTRGERIETVPKLKNMIGITRA